MKYNLPLEYLINASHAKSPILDALPPMIRLSRSNPHFGNKFPGKLFSVDVVTVG